MQLSLGQAAKEVGVSKSTLSRAIKEGKISANKKQNGSYAIDPAELFRIYEPKQSATVAETVAKTEVGPFATPEQPLKNDLEIKGLQKELEVLRERLQDKEKHIHTLQSQIEDVQHDRDEWRTEAKQRTLQIEDHRHREEALKQSLEELKNPPEEPVEEPKRFLGIFKRS